MKTQMSLAAVAAFALGAQAFIGTPLAGAPKAKVCSSTTRMAVALVIVAAGLGGLLGPVPQAVGKPPSTAGQRLAPPLAAYRRVTKPTFCPQLCHGFQQDEGGEDAG